jgi:hypothetical protein
MTTATAIKKLEAQQARETLLEHYLTEGSRVYTILRHVSSSGMSRDISLVIADKDGTITDITYYAAQATGDRLVERNGHRAIRVNGCGMDMGFHLVYNLSSVLFHGQDLPGYELRQEWL